MDQLFAQTLHFATRTIEVVGVLVIVVGIVRAGFNYVRHPSARDAYRQVRCTLRRTILLGPELSVATDIVNTVTMEPSWDSALVLGGVVLIRTFDKLSDVSRGDRENPAEALLPFLEPATAGRVREHFMQVDLDLRFVNWVLRGNHLDKVPRTVRDRCKVIQIPPLTSKDLAAVAAAWLGRTSS
ncbi:MULTISPECIES: DUF1622 domain-containing protein [Devosia]|uniref:DUF1622 domain-containing protein n=1 Tax=Devosia TaxID=46913 RepID=UPI0027355F2E|nr:DUF1622 domain-containing protein [Devosia sp.]MDP2780440.1 DUF1622 domain-containing protein [Devosia sp.]